MPNPSISFFENEPVIHQRKQSHIMPMYQRDWDRVKKMAGRIKSPSRFLSAVSSFAAGVFSSSLVSLISIYSERESHPTTYQALIYAIIISLTVSVFFYLIALTNKRDIIVRGKELVDEMTNIENDFITPIESTKEYDV